MDDATDGIPAYAKRIEWLRGRVKKTEKNVQARDGEALEWLEKKRRQTNIEVELVPISRLKQWGYFADEGIVRHVKGKDHFFSVEGVLITQSRGREVSQWDQPIFNQAEGGILAILCQEQQVGIRFLLNAKFEPGNVGKLQLAPTIQATHSNLRQHHGGRKTRFSEYWEHPSATVIYKALHNEEGARFWQKSNLNALLLLDKGEKPELAENDDYIWLSLGDIKRLMLHDNVVNPFVKTILSPI